MGCRLWVLGSRAWRSMLRHREFKHEWERKPNVWEALHMALKVSQREIQGYKVG